MARTRVIVCATGENTAFDQCPLASLPRIAQVDGNLGQRLAAGLSTALNQAPRAIAIGTDCPGLNVDDLSRMAALLDDQPLALGPSDDGGYWCLGVATAAAIAISCAADLPWSQETLLTTTQQRAQDNNMTLALGPSLTDVDTLSDWTKAVASGAMKP